MSIAGAWFVSVGVNFRSIIHLASRFAQRAHSCWRGPGVLNGCNLRGTMEARPPAELRL